MNSFFSVLDYVGWVAAKVFLFAQYWYKVVLWAKRRTRHGGWQRRGPGLLDAFSTKGWQLMPESPPVQPCPAATNNLPDPPMGGSKSFGLELAEIRWTNREVRESFEV